MKILKQILRIIFRKIKKEREISFFILFLVVAYISLFFIHNTYLVEIPKNGGEINEIIISEKPRFINPVLSTTQIDNSLVSLIYSPLLKKNKKGELVENIASYKIDKSGLKYTIKLKNNILFHDNVKMTIDDVIYTIKQIQDPLNNSFHYSEWNGVKLKKIDNFTLEIKIPKKDNYFKNSLILYIIPKHIWEKVEYFNLSNENLNPTGSGPFQIQELVSDELFINNKKEKKLRSIILKKNTNYFKGNIYIDKIIFNLFKNKTEYQNSDLFKSEKTQTYFSYTKESFLSNFKEHKIIEPINITWTIKNNNSNEFLKNIEIRKYISQILNNKEWKDYQDKLLKNKNYILDKENNLLKYKNKIISFSITTGENQETFIFLANQLKNKLRKAGISTTLKVLNTNNFWEILRERKFESIISGYQINEQNLYYYYHSSQKNDPGANIAQFNSHKIDTILTDLKTKSGSKNREEKLAELNKEINRKALIFNLKQESAYYYTNRNIDNLSINLISSDEDRFMNIKNWVLYKEQVLPIFVK